MSTYNAANRNTELPFFFYTASHRSDIEKAAMARSQLNASTVHLRSVRRLPSNEVVCAGRGEAKQSMSES
jgi:hypothetical protein